MIIVPLVLVGWGILFWVAHRVIVGNWRVFEEGNGFFLSAWFLLLSVIAALNGAR